MSGYYIGIDGGSTYLKAALIGEDRVIDTMVKSTGIDNNGTAKTLAEELCRRNRIVPGDVGYIMATGYSRKVLDIADDDISEITAHAYGVRMTAPREYRPGMIIDIGGQDSKIIYLDGNYAVKNFSMNDKCAAGTGKFMEVIAQILETTIDQIGPLSLESTAPCDINSTCVVFAQSEVISLVARKYDRRDILSGMHLSMARRIIKMMKKSERGGDILMTGGGALNVGLHKAFEEELMKDVYVAQYPQFNGAIGAALIAEDDRDISRAVSALLERNHYSVDVVYNGKDALDYMLAGDYDAAILDIMMPGMDGLEVVKRLRKAGIYSPVIMLTAMGEIEDRITGLDAGADDYLAKPFDGGELLARVRALLRRTGNFTPDIQTYQDLRLDRNNFKLSCGENHVNLGNKAFQMLEMLMRNPHKIISVNQFMEHIWGWDSEAEINVVWVNISFLRKQLAKIGSRTEIRMVRGAGYTLEEFDD